MKKLFAILITILFISSITVSALAADMPVKEEGVSTKKAAPATPAPLTQPPVKTVKTAPKSQKTSVYRAGPIQKLERGFYNAAYGWTEIPKRIVDKSNEYNNPIKGFLLGAFQGGCRAFARTASGVSEVVTFPIGRYDKPRVLPDMPAAE